jgi:hypothetical protein
MEPKISFLVSGSRSHVASAALALTLAFVRGTAAQSGTTPPTPRVAQEWGVEVIEASITELYDPSRNPGASHHNLFGLRPTKGLSSIDGIIPFRVYTKSDPTGGPRATLRLP